MNDSPLNKPQYRRAGLEDAGLICRLVKDLHRKVQHACQGIAFDLDSTAHMVIRVITDGVCVVGPNSCAGALIAPFPTNAKVRVASVVFWNFSKRKEMGVFDALILACAQTGATHIDASCHPPNPVLKRFYEERGIHLAEFHHLGEIEKCLQRSGKVVEGDLYGIHRRGYSGL